MIAMTTRLINKVNYKPVLTITCIQRPPFKSPSFSFIAKSDHLPAPINNFGSRGWSLYKGLTVIQEHLHNNLSLLAKVFSSKTKV